MSHVARHDQLDFARLRAVMPYGRAHTAPRTTRPLDSRMSPSRDHSIAPSLPPSHGHVVRGGVCRTWRDTIIGFRASMRAHVVRGGGCRTSRDTTARSAPRPLPTRAHVARRRPHRTSCDTQPAEVSRLLLVICVVFFSSAELGEGRWARASARGRQCDDDGERKREHRGAARATLRCEGEQVEPAEPGESAAANTATRMPSPSDPQLRVDGALS